MQQHGGGQVSTLSTLRNHSRPPAARPKNKPLIFPPELEKLSNELESFRGGKQASWWQEAQKLVMSKMPLRFSPGLPYHLEGQQLFMLFTDRVIIFDLDNQEEPTNPQMVGRPRLEQLDRCAWECQVAAKLFSRFTNNKQEAKEYQLLAEFYQRQAQYRRINTWGANGAPALPEW